MSEISFQNIFWMTYYVVLSLIIIFSFCKLGLIFFRKQMKKIKKEKEKKEAIRIIADWIFSIGEENEKIRNMISTIVKQHGGELVGDVKLIGYSLFGVRRSVTLSIEESVFFQPMKKIIFMCLGVYANNLQNIFSAEENIQKKLKKIKEKEQKLSDVEFFNYINIISMKISERKEVEEKIAKNLEKLGFLNTGNINEYRNIFLLFNPKITKETERKNPNIMGSEDGD